jgi:endonuclease/exonuclease/phosphatase family metal-dependent hydrolase
MQVYRPMAADLGPYPSSGRRLDWVLISDDLEFLNHEILPHMVSDHHAVVADIGLKAASENAPQGARASPRCTE